MSMIEIDVDIETPTIFFEYKFIGNCSSLKPHTCNILFWSENPFTTSDYNGNILVQVNKQEAENIISILNRFLLQQSEVQNE